MREQAPLFGDLFRVTAPKAMPETASREARRSIGPAHLNDMHRAILAALEEHGPMTDEQLQAELQMNPSTERPRRIELLDMARIRPAGEGRTLSGRRATTWAVVP